MNNSLPAKAHEFALLIAPATPPELSRAVDDLVTKMVACDPSNGSDPECVDLVMDYITHATRAKLGHIHPHTGLPHEMPGGLDYPEFTEQEFKVMDEFVDWVVAHC